MDRPDSKGNKVYAGKPLSETDQNQSDIALLKNVEKQEPMYTDKEMQKNYQSV